MPYVISTRSPFPHTQRMGDVSRCAVVTLEEVARQHPALCIAESIERPGEGLVCLFDEAGGTVGPLPDGTVIEVQAVTLSALGVKAYNAAQGS